MMKPRHEASERIEYIDVMKGFGILMLLLSHSISGVSALKTWIFSFHIPLFFCCTGTLIAAKYSDCQKMRTGLKSFVKNKTYSMLTPYVFFSFVIVLFKEFLLFLGTHQMNADRLWAEILNIIALRGAESLWFLPCLFIAEILYVMILIYFPGYGCRVMTVICVVINIAFSNSLPEGIFGAVIRASTGFVFIHFGYRMYRAKLRTDKIGWNDLLLFCLGAALSYVNGFAAIGSFEFKSVLLYYASACCTLFAITGISKQYNSLRMLPYLGRNSIVILCTNNILIEILRLLDHKMTGDFFLSHGMAGDILFAVLLIVLELPIIMNGMAHFKSLYGIRN